MRGAARPLVGERRVSASVDSLQLRRKSYTYRMTAGTAAGAGAAVAGEGAQASPVATRAYFALKIIELVFGILNVGLVVDPFRVIPETDVVHACLALVAFSSVIIVSCVLLISRLAREPVPVRATLLFLLVNGCLLVAAGGVLLADWCRMYYRIYNLQPKLYLDMMIASGIIAIFNAAAHFVDVGLTVALS
ncbi:Uncharacterized protein GBIM_11989 [Gryllus bimaculatus]|nr:Uncharacterized protein GBIM_11989 [Gryllus bimaculatus]